ncbi:MAG TPA: hypothetical protein VFL36_18215 [Myxococcales bacterium]|nr:hypothetical protein [Myxococcales bacterium]
MTFIVCEDGAEYTDRFQRFLGGRFVFVRAGHFADALSLAPGACGVLLDLDFRRTASTLLVDERGERADASAAEVQGILILRALRARGVQLPALLFADLDDDARSARLEAELAPLRVVPLSAGLAQIAQLLREMSSATGNVAKS